MSSPRQTLKAILPETLHQEVCGAYERIGDIALVTLPDKLLPYQEQIGAALLTGEAHVRLVARRRQPIGGEFRLGGFEIIAGAPPLSTTHRENGLRFAVDVDKVYFSARLAGERLRLARLCQADERVLVVGSGVAPLPLTLAAHGLAAEIMGIEKNPDAHMLALENLHLNRRHSHKVRPQLADYRDLTPADFGLFDRVIVAMPEIAGTALPHCLPFIRPGGILHVYIFHDASQPPPASEIATILTAAGREAISLTAVRCGHCGRSRFRYCLDVRLK